MKTIEERAANLAKEFAAGKQNRETAVYKSCIRMATEQRKVDEEEFHPIMEESVLKAINKQKKIDIEKACQEFCRNCRSHNDMVGNDCKCNQFEAFRKAMED
ncbi:MAG: hypothetical protein KBT36_17275 [Kurthia sp.]|nr:hypothetical protein [Candidatus Kurthia equi]